jgi:hypothetical protein
MSHFTVMVIGAEPEKQLAPFHEFECTGQNDEYVQDIDITQEIIDLMNGDDKYTLNDALDYHGLVESTVMDGQSPDTQGDDCKHKYGYAIIDAQSGLVKAVKRTNPNAKWDWYVLGGRWAGFLKIKMGEKAVVGKKSFMGAPAKDGWGDQAPKYAVDFKWMRVTAKGKAILRYRELAAKFGGEIPKLDFTWSQILADESIGDIQAKRDKYHSQDAMKKLRALTDEHFVSMEDFQCTEIEYGDMAASKAFSTYAIVIDSKWYAKGEMGWFGVSSDEMTQAEWDTKVSEMIDGLPEETLISIFDCHI